MNPWVATVFGVWLLMSCWHQVSPGTGPAWLSRLFLLPTWRFFGPIPLTEDVHVLCRGFQADHPGPWRELILRGRSGVTAAVWNPGRRTRKALFDVIVSLTHHAAHSPTVHLTVPYIALLQTTAEILEPKKGPQDISFDCMQFLVIFRRCEDPMREAYPVFLSRVHAIAGV